VRPGITALSAARDRKVYRWMWIGSCRCSMSFPGASQREQ
jgi:hypothetical protein